MSAVIAENTKRKKELGSRTVLYETKLLTNRGHRSHTQQLQPKIGVTRPKIQLKRSNFGLTRAKKIEKKKLIFFSP